MGILKISTITGLGNSNTKVETKNNTYIFNRFQKLKRTEVKNNCYLEWALNESSVISGVVEVFFSPVLVNGKRDEKIIGKWGDTSELE